MLTHVAVIESPSHKDSRVKTSFPHLKTKGGITSELLIKTDHDA